MRDEELEELLLDNNLEGSSYFTNPNFASAIVGSTEDGNIVYSYDEMITSMATDDRISVEEAQEWIDYNTLRTIPYMPNPKPIIIYDLIR